MNRKPFIFGALFALVMFTGASFAPVVFRNWILQHDIDGGGHTISNAVFEGDGSGLTGVVGAALTETDNITVSNVTAHGILKLSGATNELSVSGGALQLDGAPITGGDTVWTNDGAFIFPSGTGPVPEAFTGSNGPPIFLRSDGSLFLGTNVTDVVDPTDADTYYSLEAVSVVENGQPSLMSLFCEVLDNPANYNYWAYIAWNGSAEPSHSESQIELSASSTNHSTELELSAASDGQQGSIQPRGFIRALKDSQVLFLVETNGVVTAPSYTVSGTTNQVVFGGTNAPPSDTGTIAKWISVQVAGLTNQFRLPVYE